MRTSIGQRLIGLQQLMIADTPASEAGQENPAGDKKFFAGPIKSPKQHSYAQPVHT